MIEGFLKIEEVLERELTRVDAPRELWDRVSARQSVAPRPSRPWVWAAAMVIVVGMFIGMRLTRGTEDALAMRAAAREPGPLEFQSSKSPEIRAWVKARAGLDVPLADELPGAVRLDGARSMGADTVEIAYRVNGRRMVLVVAKSSGLGMSDSMHAYVNRGSRTATWSMRGVRFTLACATPGDLEAACLVCHGSGIPHGS